MEENKKKKITPWTLFLIVIICYLSFYVSYYSRSYDMVMSEYIKLKAILKDVQNTCRMYEDELIQVYSVSID